MFISSGTLSYYENPYKLIVSIDSEISNYYCALIPKYVSYNRQMYPPHISVVRKEIPPNLNVWRKYQDNIISFEYENYIYMDGTYIWLNIFSSSLEEIRKELGLTKTSEITRSPDGRHKFHTTLGNFKKIP